MRKTRSGTRLVLGATLVFLGLLALPTGRALAAAAPAPTPPTATATGEAAGAADDASPDGPEGIFATARRYLMAAGGRVLLILAAVIVLHLLVVGSSGRLIAILAAPISVRAKASEEAMKRVRTIAGIIRKAVLLAVWAVGLMMILGAFGIQLGPIIAAVGVLGLALSFGAQNLVRDVIGGFFMLIEDQVRIGDVAVINGTGGLVEKIGLRTIVLRDLSGTVHVFPNGAINTLSNMTKDWSAMVFDVEIAYKEDVEKVMAVMREEAEALAADERYADAILEPMEIFGIDSFGESAVTIKARIKTKPIKQWDVGRAYRLRLKKAFDARGIEIPFPHRTLYVGEDESNPLLALLKKAGGKKGKKEK